MLQTVVNARWLVAMIVSCAVGVWGLHTYPFDTENVFLAPIQLQNPSVFQVLAYGYTTLWFTTPFLAASSRRWSRWWCIAGPPAHGCRALPPYPGRRRPSHAVPRDWRASLRHQTRPRARPAVAQHPAAWPVYRRDRVGAVGTGKTSAAMFPFTDQLPRWRAEDVDRKMGA